MSYLTPSSHYRENVSIYHLSFRICCSALRSQRFNLHIACFCGIFYIRDYSTNPGASISLSQVPSSYSPSALPQYINHNVREPRNEGYQKLVS